MNRSVTVIPPKRRVGNTIAKEEKPKLKVAAYCRVSTDSEEQASSYEMQVEHYKAFIQKTKNGNLREYSQTMGSVVPIQRKEASLTE